MFYTISSEIDLRLVCCAVAAAVGLAALFCFTSIAYRKPIKTGLLSYEFIGSLVSLLILLISMIAASIFLVEKRRIHPLARRSLRL